MTSILAIGDSVRSKTGYGKVSQYVFRHFLKTRPDMQIRQIGWQHSEPPERVLITDQAGMVGNVELFPPHTFDTFHLESTIMHINGTKPDMVYNSNDIFTSSTLVRRKNELNHRLFLVNYGVIDAPASADWYRETILGTDVPVTPSKYGYEQLKKITDQGLYIPHGVDTTIFKPTDNKELLKMQCGLQNKFIYGVVHRNIFRKLLPLVIESFAHLKYRHGLKDIVLCLVTDPREQSGFPIDQLAKYYNLSISWNWHVPADIYLHPAHLNYTISLTEEQLAEAYNMFDVLVSATMSEGFGLPTIEAQACGTPVIIPNHSSNTELVEGHGWLYPTGKNIDGSPVLLPMNMPTPVGSVMYGYPVPDRVALENSMLEAYNNSELLAKYSKDAQEFTKQYDWDLVLPAWNEVLRRVDEFWSKE